MPTCSRCQKELPRSDFAKAQLKKSPDQRKCKSCVAIVMETSEHTETSQSVHQEESTSPPKSPSTATPANKESKQATEQSAAPATTSPPEAKGQTSDSDESTDSLKATIAKLQSDLDKALQTNKEQEKVHQEKITQLETKANQGMQGMERAKQKIAHLETLAGEAINGLKAVQVQASAEIDSLKKQLVAVEEERDQLLAEKGAKK